MIKSAVRYLFILFLGLVVFFVNILVLLVILKSFTIPSISSELDLVFWSFNFLMSGVIMGKTIKNSRSGMILGCIFGIIAEVSYIGFYSFLGPHHTYILSALLSDNDYLYKSLLTEIPYVVAVIGFTALGGYMGGKLVRHFRI